MIALEFLLSESKGESLLTDLPLRRWRRTALQSQLYAISKLCETLSKRFKFSKLRLTLTVELEPATTLEAQLLEDSLRASPNSVPGLTFKISKKASEVSSSPTPG